MYPHTNHTPRPGPGVPPQEWPRQGRICRSSYRRRAPGEVEPGCPVGQQQGRTSRQNCPANPRQGRSRRRSGRLAREADPAWPHASHRIASSTQAPAPARRVIHISVRCAPNRGRRRHGCRRRMGAGRWRLRSQDRPKVGMRADVGGRSAPKMGLHAAGQHGGRGRCREIPPRGGP